jgi:uncharacterized protein YbcV (DUF1398 family)
MIMFTLEQIKSAHSKVKSGADFPAYIREIKELGVSQYEAYVTDGHVDYLAAGDYIVKSPGRYEPLIIAATPDINQFKAELLAHQQGKTDYLQFINMCAGTGVEKWEVRIDNMTCTYFDQAGREVLVEKIPG